MAGAESFQVSLDYIELTKHRLDLAINSLAPKHLTRETLVGLQRKLLAFEDKVKSPEPQVWQSDELDFLKEIQDTLFVTEGRNIRPAPLFEQVTELQQVRYASTPLMIPFQLDNAGIRVFRSADERLRKGESVALQDIGKREFDDGLRLQYLQEVNSNAFKMRYRSTRHIEDQPVSRWAHDSYTHRLTEQTHPLKVEWQNQILNLANEATFQRQEELRFILDFADQYGVPRLQIYPHELGSMVSLINKAADGKPVNVLEVGTLVGYSAIGMAMGLPKGSKITTCEINPLHYLVAVENVKRAEELDLIDEGSIEVKYGDAADVIAQLNQANRTFDVAFLDADKQAKRYIELLSKNPPKLLISDNATRKGRVADPQIRDDMLIHDANMAAVGTPGSISQFYDKQDGDRQLVVWKLSEKEKTQLRLYKSEYIRNWETSYELCSEAIQDVSIILDKVSALLLGIEVPEYELTRYIRDNITDKLPIETSIKATIPLITELGDKYFGGNSKVLSEFLQNELPEAVRGIAKQLVKLMSVAV